MNDLKIAQEVISDYINESLFSPGSRWPMYEFEKRCFERWSAEELLLYLQNHWGECSASDLVLRFIRMMDAYSDIREGTYYSYRFIIARDTAKEILYLFQ